MIFLGVDPGTTTTGYGVVEIEGNRRFHVAHGVIRTPYGMPQENKLSLLHEAVTELINRHRPDVLAMEELFFSTNVKTGIAVAQAQGVILLAAFQTRRHLMSFTPNQVKQAVTQNGRAVKREVQVMVQRLLSLDDLPSPDDAADGLAVALCAAHQPSWAGAVRASIR